MTHTCIAAYRPEPLIPSGLLARSKSFTCVLI